MARREVTGKKVGVNADPPKPEDRDEYADEPPLPPKLLAFTIPQFVRLTASASGCSTN